mmetsp:Transcript_12561/g.26575  ORF Transcript_12561/g.26575 Transcript_12561/m.26575 type:complete len:202 (+) Transcript_12561:198-803(+)
MPRRTLEPLRRERPANQRRKRPRPPNPPTRPTTAKIASPSTIPSPSTPSSKPRRTPPPSSPKCTLSGKNSARTNRGTSGNTPTMDTIGGMPPRRTTCRRDRMGSWCIRFIVGWESGPRWRLWRRRERGRRSSVRAERTAATVWVRVSTVLLLLRQAARRWCIAARGCECIIRDVIECNHATGTSLSLKIHTRTLFHISVAP